MIEAMKQALEALYWASDQTEPQQNDHCLCPICKGIDALRQAIAEAEKQEPVAWMDEYGRLLKYVDPICPTDTPLYTHPQPKREPLTDEQCLDLAEGCTAQYHDLLALCRAIEAAHGIKENT